MAPDKPPSAPTPIGFKEPPMDQSLLQGLAKPVQSTPAASPDKSDQLDTAAALADANGDFGPVVHPAEPAFVDIPEMPSRADLQMEVSSDVPVDPQKVREFARKQAALREREEFLEKIREARKPLPVKTYVPPPVPPRVAEQTRLEMAEGRRQNEIHQARKANNPPPAPEPNSAGGVHDLAPPAALPEPPPELQPPPDYVPDQKKGQGMRAHASVRAIR